MWKKAPCLAAVLALSACASDNWAIVSGSRANGTVTAAYEQSMFQKAQTSTDGALALAKRRCQAWGYTDAEAFDRAQRSCVMRGPYGCELQRHTIEFQCTTGNGQYDGMQAAQNPMQPQRPAPNSQVIDLRPIN